MTIARLDDQPAYPTDAMVVGLHPLVDWVGALVDHLRWLKLVLQGLWPEQHDSILVAQLCHHLSKPRIEMEERRVQESKTRCYKERVAIPPQHWCEQRARSLSA